MILDATKNKTSKLKAISPGNIKMSHMPVMTPKTTSHYNLLKVINLYIIINRTLMMTQKKQCI